MERTIRIGEANVGLIGLEGAVTDLLASPDAHRLSPSEAARRLLVRLETRNYVPPGAKEAYEEALAKLWIRRHGEVVEEAPSPLTIRILGPGCVSCNRLEQIVRLVLDQKSLAADIEHVHDLDEIWRHGVEHTPALVINGRVLCAGRMPSQAQVEAWLHDITNDPF